MADLGLINMNGRLYDPQLARFISADSVVPEPYNSQSYNRFSYVNNSPFRYTDPSGFFTDPLDTAADQFAFGSLAGLSPVSDAVLGQFSLKINLLGVINHYLSQNNGLFLGPIGQGGSLGNPGLEGEDEEEEVQQPQRIVLTGTGNITAIGEGSASASRLTLRLETVPECAGCPVNSFELTATSLPGFEIIGPPISSVNFEVLLVGPEVLAVDASIISALDNKLVTIDSSTITLGVGFSIGSLRIGDFFELRSIVGTTGFGIGFSGFRGISNVQNIKPTPLEFR